MERKKTKRTAPDRDPLSDQDPTPVPSRFSTTAAAPATTRFPGGARGLETRWGLGVVGDEGYFRNATVLSLVSLLSTVHISSRSAIRSSRPKSPDDLERWIKRVNE